MFKTVAFCLTLAVSIAISGGSCWAQGAPNARVRAIEQRAEQAAASHVNNFKLIGVGPDLLNSTIFMEYINGPRKILTFYHFLGLAFSNPALDKLNARRWNLGEGDGNAIEIMYKLKGRPTKGLLFTIDGNDLFGNFMVENDTPYQFRENYNGAAMRSQIMREITGISEQEWTSFFE